MRNLLHIFVMMLFIASCQKDSIVENVIIEDNPTPHYDEVTTVQIQNYVNKIYIDLLGREPLESELTAATTDLKSNALSDASRDLLLAGLMNLDEYYNRFYEIYQVAYLPGVTKDELDLRIYLFEVERDNAIVAGNDALLQFINAELALMYNLRNSKKDYQNGDITINEFMAILCNNSFYEEINMGAENFALACFENFLKRNPTDAELTASVEMVSGGSSQIFFQDGNNKIDFINIITNIPEMYQGLAIDIYNQLLVRLPDSQEMGEAILMLDVDQDYQAVQRKVMKSDEYAGF